MQYMRDCHGHQYGGTKPELADLALSLSYEDVVPEWSITLAHDEDPQPYGGSSTRGSGSGIALVSRLREPRWAKRKMGEE